MSLLDDWKQIPSLDRHVRQFCALMGLVAAAVGAWQAWKGDSTIALAAAAAVAFFAAGHRRPALARPAQRAWMRLALTLGWLMTRVILLVLFALVVTPTGRLRRIFEKDPELRRAPSTYWRERTESRGTYDTQY